MLTAWQKQDPLKRRFTLPNELFSLGLSSNEISVYAYLLYCENRKTHQCWPSYHAISRAVGLSRKTVKKYVTELVEKGLITTENTTITTKDGRKRNGSLLYTVRPIQEAVELHHQRQLRQVELDAQRRRSLERQEEYNRRHPTAAPCAAETVEATPDPSPAT